VAGRYTHPVYFLVPPIAVAVLLAVGWSTGLLTYPVRIGACWLAGVYLQFFSSSVTLSLAGLLINVVVGVYLSIRLKLG
jgi:hypothetical protein